jgi:hypothetical protein
MSAVDVSSDYSPHNKFSWEDEVRERLSAEGPISLPTLGLASIIRASVGTANDHTSHVNVCWRTSASLTEEMGCSADTYRRHRDVLEEEGLLFSIASGRGPQKILILKHPEESKFEALKTAVGSLSAYRSRTDNPRLGWVFEAIRCAYAKHRPSDSSPAENSAEEPTPDNSDHTRKSRRADTQNSHASIIYMKRQHSNVCSSSYDDFSSQQATQPPPQPTNQSSSRSESSDVVDFEHIRKMCDEWRRLFESFGRPLDEGCALKLARSYAEKVSSISDLQEGMYRTPSGSLEAIESRLARLFGDEQSVGRVVSYLLDDADEFFVSDRHSETTRQDVSRSKTSESEPGDSEDSCAEYHRVMDELTQSGCSMEEANRRARRRADEQGWSVPEPIQE